MARKIELHYKRRVNSEREKKLYAILVVTRRQRLALELLCGGEVLVMGHWGETIVALARKGLVRRVRGGRYKLSRAGREYVRLKWPWVVNGS